MIAVTAPLKIPSVANLRLSWAAKAKMVKAQRTKVRQALQCMAAAPLPHAAPLTVVLTRVAPRSLDTDNLVASLKAVRDGVADYLGVDDGSAQLDWQYVQRKGTCAVEVEII